MSFIATIFHVNDIFSNQKNLKCHFWQLINFLPRGVSHLAFRTTAKAEVDFVLENRRGKLVGVEVKAAASCHPADFSGLKKLAELTGDRFLAGVLLYDGTQTLPMGRVNDKPLWAVPLATLWLT